MRRGYLLLFGLIVVLMFAGCAPQGLDHIRRGMMPNDVNTIMRMEPTKILRGDGADTGYMLFIYPDGKIIFRNLKVTEVIKTGDEPTINERHQKLREQM
jgi:hypothetical protein